MTGSILWGRPSIHPMIQPSKQQRCSSCFSYLCVESVYWERVRCCNFRNYRTQNNKTVHLQTQESMCESQLVSLDDSHRRRLHPVESKVVTSLMTDSLSKRFLHICPVPLSAGSEIHWVPRQKRSDQPRCCCSCQLVSVITQAVVQLKSLCHNSEKGILKGPVMTVRPPES